MKKTTIFLLSMFFAVDFFAVGAFASFEFREVDIHGFISQGYLQSDDHKYLTADTDDGTFEFNEFGINFSTDVNENLRLGIQLLGRDVGNIGNDDVEIDWAYADYRYRNWLGMRVGKIKQPGGLYNQSRDIDSARTCILLPQSVYDERYREALLTLKGVGFYGTLPGHLEYQVVYGNMDAPSDGGLVQTLEQWYPIVKVDDIDPDPSFSGELYWNTPLEGLRVGYTFSEHKFDVNTNEVNFGNAHAAYLNGQLRAAEAAVPPAFGGPLPPGYLGIVNPGWNDLDQTMDFDIKYDMFSAEYTYENFMISAEYVTGDIEVEAPGTENTKNDAEIYYVMTTYRFTDWFELGFYYSVYYPDKDDKDGKDRQAAYDNWLAAGGPLTGPNEGTTYLPPPSSIPFKAMGYIKDYALSTRFDINEYWIFKLEVHIMDGLYGVDFSESDDPLDPDSDWTLFAAKLSYSF